MRNNHSIPQRQSNKQSDSVSAHQQGSLDTTLISKGMVTTTYSNVAAPLKNVQISSKYGMRFHPIMRKRCMHNGIDLRAKYEPVYSMLPGEVVRVGASERSGKYITIQTANYTISYCHLSSWMVQEGNFINTGELIGVSGNSGTSTAPHLHLTMKKDDKVIDPTILIEYVQKLK